MALQGLDLSAWQGGNYQTLIDNYAKDFVIVRATFSRVVDSYCDKIYQYAKSKGKKLGFYMFPLTSDGDARAAAEWNYNQVKGYIKEAIPCIDWESVSGYAHNIADVNWAYNFAKRFEELSGVKPVFYMNGSCEASYDWSKIVANNSGLWLAAWGANDGKDHGTPATKHWKVVAIHQFTSRYAGQSLDADTFNGDGGAWDKYAGKSGSTPAPQPTPAPAPAKKSNEQIAMEVIAGKWGNGDDRKNRLAKAGYDYNAIQSIVNQKMGASPVTTYYVVKAGDTLSGIAAKYGTTYQKLAQMNGIKDPNKIYPNQRIRVK